MKNPKSPRIPERDKRSLSGEWNGDDGERGRHFPVKPLDPKRWSGVEVGV